MAAVGDAIGHVMKGLDLSKTDARWVGWVASWQS